MIPTENIHATLAETFGFTVFRPNQEEIVRAILSRQSVFVVMPTGGGKSLCYQLPARLMKGVCIVISPLISLMKDQVDAARANGLQAAALNSTNTVQQRNDIRDALHANELDLLYLSPERFNSENFLERLKTLDISFFAVDEAHCISEWGHDFRPDYLALARISEEFPDVPVAAFTATATPRVAEDIIHRLKLKNPHLTRASFNRPNLFYQVIPKQRLDHQLLDFLKRHPNESGIVYRTSRKKVEETAAFLQSHGFSALSYHAGMSDEDRHAAQEAFRRDECAIIAATIAFGMGIDKSNVRFVVHGDLPKNIEGYYQETGRAGRDGEPAHCTLFFGRQDIALLARFAEEIEDAQAREVATAQLWQMVRFAEQDGCRRVGLLRYFGEEFPETNCGNCDVCIGEVEREDATVAAQKVLSAVYRTGQRFGAGHICDIVVGANTEKIRQFQHDRLPTYGVGKDRPKSYWRTVLDALVARKILVADDPKRPILKLTDDAWAILRDKRPFQILRQQPCQPDQLQKPRVAVSRNDAPAWESNSLSERLFQRLRELRKEIAMTENLPPYIVFSDKSLREMSHIFPINNEEFLLVTGVGQRKLETYGEAFLAAINDFCLVNREELFKWKKYRDGEKK